MLQIISKCLHQVLASVSTCKRYHKIRADTNTSIVISMSLMHIYTYNCFFTNNMHYFPTNIGSEGKEGAAADGHSYHAY